MSMFQKFHWFMGRIWPVVVLWPWDEFHEKERSPLFLKDMHLRPWKKDNIVLFRTHILTL